VFTITHSATLKGDLEMKRILLAGFMVVVIGVGVYVVWPKSGNMNAILKLSESGASEEKMLNVVQSNSTYTLSADDVVKLNNAKVPNTVIIEMLNKAPKSAAANANP
jgi:hypothetical protein